MSIQFGANTAAGKLLADLWQDLQKYNGARAELRRCKAPVDVMMNPLFQRYCSRMKPLMGGSHGWEERFAMIVGLVSHLKRDDAATVLASPAEGKDSYIEYFIAPLASLNGDRPIVSELRFRRLLQRELEDLYPALIRTLRMVDGRSNLYGLAESVFYWGDNMKKRWAFAYFPKLPEKKSA
jgi:CRISPR system Cascade subunit CasB